MNHDIPHVVDMAESARLVRDYLQGVTRNDFMNSIQLQDSVIRRFGIIGEAARRVSTEFRELHPEIPWGEMIGLRNRVVHGYDSIDLVVLWKTAQRRIPELLALIEPLIPPRPDA